VLPDTTDVVIVMGDSPVERYWVEELRAAFQPLESRVRFIWFNKLSLEEMLSRAAGLPSRHAIFFGLLSVVLSGVPRDDI
jgi:hypothetical protein